MRTVQHFSTIINKSYFVTTPIFYVNAAPHLGHLYSCVIADTIQRWSKIKNLKTEILFSTGTDEHGIKIQQAAALSKTSVAEYCSTVSDKYKYLFQLFNINYSNFIRTTDENHRKAVTHFWNEIDKNGHIYMSQYAGWYCVSDETFLSESQLTEKVLSNGKTIKVSSESGHPVEWSEEQNYIFRLSAFRDDLKRWLQKCENSVKPKKFYKILYEMADSEAMSDVSISRPNSRVHWGIPVPSNPEHTIYVWMDALVNYLTAAGYPNTQSTKFKNSWPPNVQVIGKDILKFHGIYWPAFLIAAGLDVPETLLCHSHWTIDGQKMSKSKNNVVCPIDKMQIYTAEGLRYFLLREGVNHSDGNYSEIKVLRILNSELADTLGNLLSRCTGTALNPNQEIPAYNSEVFDKMLKEDFVKTLIDKLKLLPEISQTHYDEFNFYKVTESVISTLHTVNSFFDHMKPWELKKSISMQDELNFVLYLTMETLRICGIILQPIIPILSESLLNKLKVPKDERFWTNITTLPWENRSQIKSVKLSAEKTILFKRILLKNEKSKQTSKLVS